MLRSWATRLGLAAVLIGSAGLIACNGNDDDVNGNQTPAANGQTPAPQVGTVTVLGIWGDEELESFEAMVAGWPGQMNFIGTRGVAALLVQRVEGGNAPDVALPAEIGLFQKFARDGRLTPLSECPELEDTIRDNYPESFIELGTVDGTLYGFFMKADTKATIWYNPSFFDEHDLEALGADASVDDLLALSGEILETTGVAPWSMGLESGEDSGWPGSDTIQQIFLNEAGEEAYDGVIDGSVPWTDDRMRDAWEKFGQIALTDGYTVQGGAAGINATQFVDSSYPPFQSPPTAAMVYLGGFAAGFITDQFPDAEADTDFDFMEWPGGAVTGSANIAYAFNANETTCSFLSYLASAEAQVWVERGGFTSLHSGVDMNAYPDEPSRRQAEQLLEAGIFRFDLDDAIGGAVQRAVFQGVQEYLQNPNNLDSILQGIEAARE